MFFIEITTHSESHTHRENERGREKESRWKTLFVGTTTTHFGGIQQQQQTRMKFLASITCNIQTTRTRNRSIPLIVTTENLLTSKHHRAWIMHAIWFLLVRFSNGFDIRIYVKVIIYGWSMSPLSYTFPCTLHITHIIWRLFDRGCMASSLPILNKYRRFDCNNRESLALLLSFFLFSRFVPFDCHSVQLRPQKCVINMKLSVQFVTLSWNVCMWRTFVCVYTTA